MTKQAIKKQIAHINEILNKYEFNKKNRIFLAPKYTKKAAFLYAAFFFKFVVFILLFRQD